MEVVDSVSYTTGSCKMMTACLQRKLQCMFTNDKNDQSEWRI